MVTECPGYSGEFDPDTIFRRILIPVDYTPESRRAMITACETRKRFGSEIFLFVECETEQNSSAHRDGIGNRTDPEDVERFACEQLRCFAGNVCQGAPCTSYEATYGSDVVEGIEDAVRKCRATMVILPYHPRRSLLRSRTERIVRNLDVPVFVLKCAEEETADVETLPQRGESKHREERPVILSRRGRIIANPRWPVPCRARSCEACTAAE